MIDHDTTERGTRRAIDTRRLIRMLTPSSAINGILAMPEFKEQFGGQCIDEKGQPAICTKDSSIIVAILSAGTALGALLSAPAGDSIGRRKTLMLAVGIFCIGSIFQVCAQDIPMMLVGRFVETPGRYNTHTDKP
jgi:SP family sugar:H+ symporter-like MFS transporter